MEHLCGRPLSLLRHSRAKSYGVPSSDYARESAPDNARFLFRRPEPEPRKSGFFGGRPIRPCPRRELRAPGFVPEAEVVMLGGVLPTPLGVGPHRGREFRRGERQPFGRVVWKVEVDRYSSTISIEAKSSPCHTGLAFSCFA